MGIVELLTVIFVICKILGIGSIANWTWWQVFMPQIIACIFYLLIVAGFIIFLIWATGKVK